MELVGKHDGVPLDDIADAQLLSDLLPLALISFQIDNEIDKLYLVRSNLA